MGNLAKIKQEWDPVCTESLFVIPSDHPVVCMENKRTKEHAYYDIKMERFLSQQEAFDVLNNGMRW